MKKNKSAINTRPFSSILFDGDERAAARAMLYPVGFKAEDFKKPLIGVASTSSDVTPCNRHIDKLALESQKGVNEGIWSLAIRCRTSARSTCGSWNWRRAPLRSRHAFAACPPTKENAPRGFASNI